MRQLAAMIRAEVVKLAHRRGMIAGISVLLLGMVLVWEGSMEVLHLADPAHHGAAGGTSNFLHVAGNGLALMVILAGAIVGGTAGAADSESGVFRTLVATGRSRVTLALVRVPGALAVLLPVAGVAFALATAGDVALAGGLPAPDLATIGQTAAYLLALACVTCVLACGVASAVDSRSAAIGGVIVWMLGICTLLANVSLLGDLRRIIPTVAIDSLGSGRPGAVTDSLAVALLVIAAWIAVPAAAGAWQVARRDA